MTLLITGQTHKQPLFEFQLQLWAGHLISSNSSEEAVQK